MLTTANCETAGHLIRLWFGLAALARKLPERVSEAKAPTLTLSLFLLLMYACSAPRACTSPSTRYGGCTTAADTDQQGAIAQLLRGSTSAPVRSPLQAGNGHWRQLQPMERQHASTASSSSADVNVLFVTRTVRLWAYGTIGVVLALFLDQAGFSGKQIGTLLTLTLLGDSAISLVVTLCADRVGRKLMLVSSSLLAVLAGVVFTWRPTVPFWALILAATIGVISPSGNEVGLMMACSRSTHAHKRPHGLGGCTTHSRPHTRGSVPDGRG